jgi:predicted nucleotidyltransferase
MARIPAEVSALLQELGTRLPAVLGKSLVGVYLYGSLTQNAFDPARSDVDCLVVTRRDLSDAQFRRLDAWLARLRESNPWASRLQTTFLVRGEVLRMNAKACHYQFGVLRRGGSDGNPIVWLNVLESGVRLYGESPESFVPEITPEILFEALRREVDYLREELSLKPQSEWRDMPFYRAYAVLTLCRILYTHAKGKVVSKPRAARWAVRNLPEGWRELVLRALAADYGWLGTKASLSRIRRFVAFAGARLRVSACCPSGSRRARARR